MNLINWIVAIMFASICGLGMIMIYSDLATTYGIQQLDESYEKTFNTVESTTSLTAAISGNISLINPTKNFPNDVLGGALNAGWSVVKLIFGTVPMTHAIIVDLGETVGLPAYFTDTLLAVIIVIVGLLLVSALMRWKMGGE